ncbi:YggS family pyridoxal phosphate enzyme [Halobacteriovorax marinus]|uniref:YggS family pyridoxal phosphate-dependent enzyme n=1 Tax=Halobacteriovorax marinus TaxID=97084 RepID=UPI000BC328D8|nr:YggS family pyridoxal phosphate-dependent enzyme [Halobacteriovorax marinus]ATH07757.1 YggS family pyridoxal phosphate enzyme [Halobacteriovorax marinus]
MTREELLEKRFKEFNSKLKEKTNKTQFIAVTKYSPVDDIFISYNLGHRDFGENRVLDLQEKALEFEKKGLDDVHWHFIGHLQSNKINRLLKIPNLKYIHSIDSLSLLEQILAKEDQYRGERLGLFLQVNTSAEEQKQGFSTYDSLAGAVNHFLDEHGKRIYLKGLMTMGKIRTSDIEGEARECFKKLHRFKERLADDFGMTDLCLSMGMSGDYEVAIEEGSDFIRVGSALYKSEDHS